MSFRTVAIFFGILCSLAGTSVSTVSAQEIPPALCKEFARSIFKPCICADQVPEEIKYRPAVDECGGKAAAVLFGPYANSFSVVLRDKMNRDRWPQTRYNGCTQRETAAGLNKCSAFKCQKVLKVTQSSVGTGAQQICCFGEAGNTRILRGATRMTIKVADIPSSSADPLLRICLQNFSPLVPLN